MDGNDKLPTAPPRDEKASTKENISRAAHESAKGESCGHVTIHELDMSNTDSSRRRSIQRSVHTLKKKVSTVVSEISGKRDNSWIFRRVDNVVLAFVQRNIFRDRPLYSELSKKDFESILLKELGPQEICSDFVDHLFEECDEDKNGWITVEELTSYIHKIKPSTKWRRRHFVATRLLTSFSLWGLLLFLTGGMLSATNNLLSRHGTTFQGFSAVVVGITMWCFLLGSFIFLFVSSRQIRKEESEESGNDQERKIKLKSPLWVRVTAPANRILQLVMSLDQLINFCWLIGSAAFLLAAYAQKLGVQAHVESELWGLGGVLYLVGGLLFVPSAYIGMIQFLVATQDLQLEIYALVATSVASGGVVSSIQRSDPLRYAYLVCSNLMSDSLEPPLGSSEYIVREKGKLCESSTSTTRRESCRTLLPAGVSLENEAKQKMDDLMDSGVIKSTMPGSRKDIQPTGEARVGFNHSQVVDTDMVSEDDKQTTLQHHSSGADNPMIELDADEGVKGEDYEMNIQQSGEANAELEHVQLVNVATPSSQEKHLTVQRDPSVGASSRSSSESGADEGVEGDGKLFELGQPSLRPSSGSAATAQYRSSALDLETRNPPFSATGGEPLKPSDQLSNLVERILTRTSEKTPTSDCEHGGSRDSTTDAREASKSTRRLSLVPKSGGKRQTRRRSSAVQTQRRLSLIFVEMLQSAANETNVHNASFHDGSLRESDKASDVSTLMSILQHSSSRISVKSSQGGWRGSGSTSHKDQERSSRREVSRTLSEHARGQSCRRRLSPSLLQRVVVGRSIIGYEISFVAGPEGEGEAGNQKAGDCHELYLGLLEAGVDINLDAYINVFQALDKDGTGMMDNETFVRMMDGNRKSYSALKNHLTVLRELPQTIPFWTAILYIIAGSFFVLGSYGSDRLTSNQVSNLFLTGSILYILTSVHAVIQACRGASSWFARLESNRLRLKSKIFEHARAEAANRQV